MSKFNIGAGACPAGSSPAGFGVPGSIPSAYPRALVTADARVGSAAALNTKTGDYVVDATGQRVGSDAAPPMVYLALRTIKGSAATLDLGIGEFPKMRDEDVGTKLRALVDDALAALVSAGRVSIIDVTAGPTGPSGATITVKWRDLSSGQVQTSFV